MSLFFSPSDTFFFFNREAQLKESCLHFHYIFFFLSQAIMAQLPQEEKAKIAEQVESFRQEKSKLDAEVAKWDDNGNDIIVLAKQMCMIMMEMTDFTRYTHTHTHQ